MRATMNGNTVRVEFEMGHVDPEMLAWLTLMSNASKSTANDRDIETLSDTIKADWWALHGESLLSEDRS